MKHTLKNRPKLLTMPNGRHVYSIRAMEQWFEGFERALRKKDAKFRKVYLNYDEEDIGILIREMLGEQP